jgi:hypothetical protein
MNDFVNGATALACFAIGLFFVRFHRESHDRFFALFALAFCMFGVNRIILTFLPEASEARPYVYVFRLLAFLLIIVAIVDKNLAESPRPKARSRL